MVVFSARPCSSSSSCPPARRSVKDQFVGLLIDIAAHNDIFINTVFEVFKDFPFLDKLNVPGAHNVRPAWFSIKILVLTKSAPHGVTFFL